MLNDPELRAQTGYPSDEEIRHALGGRDLACWCDLNGPCHVDVLLQISNTAEELPDAG